MPAIVHRCPGVGCAVCAWERGVRPRPHHEPRAYDETAPFTAEQYRYLQERVFASTGDLE